MVTLLFNIYRKDNESDTTKKVEKKIANSFGFYVVLLFNIYESKLVITNKNFSTMARISNTLFNNHDYDFEDARKDYMDCYEDENPTDAQIFDFMNDSYNAWWDDFLYNVKHCTYNRNAWVVCGSLGLWNGRRTICPKTFDSLEDAIRACCGGDHIIIKQVNGHVEVTSSHHDGTNTFELHLLNNDGIDADYRITRGWGNADLSRRAYHKAIKGHLFE